MATWRQRAVSAIATVALSTPAAFARGPEGHKIVAEIADKRLTVNAKREMKKLLGAQSMADVANYADAYKESHTETKPWHYVDIPVSKDNQPTTYDPDRDGHDHNNVIDQIVDDEATVQDKNGARADRQLALKMLIHFIGDIHQPLHCAEKQFNGAPDQGGNDEKVHYPGERVALKLHGVWDGTIIKDELLSTDGDEITYADGLAQKLDTDASFKQQVIEWEKVTDPTDWANESNVLAAKYAYTDIPTGHQAGAAWSTLSDAYVKAATPVVETQLEKAGVRLADSFNRMFP